MFKNILIPIDGGSYSHYMARQALAFAQALGAEVTFLHVVVNDIRAAYALSHTTLYLDTMLAEMHQAGEALLEQAQQWAQAKNVPCHTQLVETDTPVHAIIEAEKDFDLVIMATQHRQGLEHLFIGSITEEALRQGNKPYLVLHCPQQAENYHDTDNVEIAVKRVMIALDSSECSDAALNEGCRFAQSIGASVKLVHVFESPILAYATPELMTYPVDIIEESRQAARKSLEHAAQKAQALGIAVESEFIEQSNTRVHQAIIEAGADADITVMATHGRRGFDKMLLGSVTERVLRHSRQPQLVCHCQSLEV